MMSGSGVLTDKNGVAKDCIIRENAVLCSIDELYAGVQVEFKDQSLQLYSGYAICYDIE